MNSLHSATSRARQWDRPSRRELRAQQTLAARCAVPPDASSVQLEADIMAADMEQMPVGVEP